jgi:predicted phage terminase large subunit-like protein
MATLSPSVPDDWREWPVEQKRRFLRRLRERKHGNWREQARPDQLPPEDEWTTLFLSGGRGSGKTWGGAHILVEEIEHDPAMATEGPGVWAIVAPTFADARDKCVEGESGLLAALHTTQAEVKAGISPTVAVWNRSLGEVVLHDGTKIVIDGADDGAPTIQGENLRGAWCDEIGLWKKWKEAWDEAIGYAVRKGRARRIVTGTPKRDKPARVLVKRLIAEAKTNPRIVARRLLTKDNWANLSDTFKDTVMLTASTELGRQELEGIMLEEAEGALWKRAWIDKGRVASVAGKTITKRLLALDPADGLEDGDEQAMCLVGEDEAHEYYVIRSEGMRKTPTEWLTAAVTLANETGAAIVVEKNHGGAFLVELLEQIMGELGIRVPVLEVTASDGKRTRAEPVAMLYEQGHNTGHPVVHHVGDLPDLEDQQCNWTGEPGIPSPDQMDACVWGLTGLMTGVGVRRKRKVKVGT